MTKIILIFSALILLIGTAFAEKKLKNKVLSWDEVLEDALPINEKKTKKYKVRTLSWKDILRDAQTKSNWSFFWQAINHPLDFKLTQFESGLLFYYKSQKNWWELYRFEPYIKLHWSILDKYLQLYLLFGLDATNVDYVLSEYSYGNSILALRANLSSRGNMFFGGGIKFLLVGWKNLNFYAYMQTQMTPKNDAQPESADLKLDNLSFDLKEIVQEHITVDYKIQRYDIGLTASYKFFKWFTAYGKFGYIWMDININLIMDEELASTVRTLTGIQPRDIIPNRLPVEVRSVFGSLGVRFKIYKWLNVGLEGIVVPDEEQSIYFGQFSIIIED